MTADAGWPTLLDNPAADHGTIPSAIDPAEGSPSVRRDPEIPRLVGVTEAAEILGLSYQRVWQLIQEGELPAVKPARDYLLRELAVLEYKAQMELDRSRRHKD